MIDAADREILESTIRSALGDAEPGSDIDALLRALDWIDLLEAEPADAIDIVFTALGAANARSTALDDVLLTALGIPPSPEVSVLLPPFATWAPVGRIEGAEVQADGLATARGASAKELVVLGGTAEAPRMATVSTASAERIGTAGVDPASGIQTLRVKTTEATSRALDTAVWEQALAFGRRALAYEIAGAARTMLEMARSHALEREQFGAPIAGFQAVRHRLAEVLVAVESIDASLVAASEEPNAATAALAKALASRSMRVVAKHCQQVLAGVGFTTDHAFHLYLKRTMLLEGLLGSGDAILLDMGRRLIHQRQAPALIEL